MTILSTVVHVLQILNDPGIYRKILGRSWHFSNIEERGRAVLHGRGSVGTSAGPRAPRSELMQVLYEDHDEGSASLCAAGIMCIGH